MRTWKRDLISGRERTGAVLLIIIVLILCAAIPAVLPGQTQPDEPHVLSVYFKFNSAELNRRSREALQTYLDNRGPNRRYLLVQGFGCERGGFANSLTAAETRSNSVQAILIQAGITRDRYRIAPGGVMRGEPREPHRRVEIRGYGDERGLEFALLRARELTRRLNVAKDRAKQEEILARYRKLMRESPGREETGIWAGYWIIAIIVLLAVVVILLLLLIFRNRNRNRREKITQSEQAQHKLTQAEAEELAAITGEEPIPVTTAQSAPRVEALPAAEGPAENREIVDGPRAQAKPPAETPVAKEVRAQARAASVKSPGASLQESIRSKLNMASKKKSKSAAKTSAAKSSSTKSAAKTSKPISIGRAVEKAFEGKSLSQLAKSPINALEGLTPRHARMLEEGFGIKTIEDLAQLKYFEIARAIVVLAKYE